MKYPDRKAVDIQKNSYDAEVLRCQMEENGQLITFIYSGDSVVDEEDSKGAVTRYLRGHRLLASDSEAAQTYYHYASDEMGSITDIVDAEGNSLNHYA